MAKGKAPTNAHDIQCLVCGGTFRDYLGDHLLEGHGMTVRAYLTAHPGAATTSQRLMDLFHDRHKSPKRAHPAPPGNLTISFANVDFTVHPDVPAQHCLPMPENYRVPEHGRLGEDVQHAAVALKHRRSIYVWGLPGCGKDAAFHFWSAATRTPAIMRQVKPGTDIEAWFFSRAFHSEGTFWEDGALLTALRDGYTTATGRVIPYLILITDFDRADPQQAENLRLVTDSIQGRVEGPNDTYKVVPGTIIAVTGNTAGGGDERGRMISANPLDGSLTDRFERAFQFHWMDWKDEGPIVRSKFPLLARLCPSAISKMGHVTKALREAIWNNDLYGEFSHRGLCSILGHAQDMLEENGGKVTKNLLKLAARAWVDKLPDEENREAARKIIDPKVGMLPEGDTSHIKPGEVEPV